MIMIIFSTAIFSQTKVGSRITQNIPIDGNKNITAVNVLFDAEGEKYYYSTCDKVYRII